MFSSPLKYSPASTAHSILPSILVLILFPHYTFSNQNSVGCSDVRVIRADSGLNGTISSPGYPDQYPSGVRCEYHFNGVRADQRVQLTFTQFELYQPHKDLPKDCEGVDQLEVFILRNKKRERVDNFCGSKIPPQLMSNGPELIVSFQSQHSNEPRNQSAFRAIYNFVTNFGVTAGKQTGTSNCSFVFNSTESSNGSFTSPNWPGLYPRDTECNYFFFGQDSERVHITFKYFDVDGVPPCDRDTLSDFLEFSNFPTVDRKMPRYCGSNRPSTVESDVGFFRVTFRSNEKFDATGFDAFYRFHAPKEQSTMKRAKSNSAPRFISFPRCLLQSVILLALTL